MELLKNIKSAVNFEDRYSDMEGSEGGYSRKERKALDRAKKSGASLRGYQEDRSEYLDTVSNERKRFAGNVASTAGRSWFRSNDRESKFSNLFFRVGHELLRWRDG